MACLDRRYVDGEETRGGDKRGVEGKMATACGNSLMSGGGGRERAARVANRCACGAGAQGCDPPLTCGPLEKPAVSAYWLEGHAGTSILAHERDMCEYVQVGRDAPMCACNNEITSKVSRQAASTGTHLILAL